MKEKDYTLKAKDGIDLYFKEWVPEGKIRGMVALIHGLGEHCNRYQHVAKTFCDSGFLITSFDLRGHGRSGGLRGHSPSYQNLMDDITLLLSTMESKHPDLPEFLYGHSLGGNLVLYYLLTQPKVVKAAIVTSPGLGLAMEPPKLKLALGEIMYKLLPTFSMDNGLDTSGLSRDKAVVTRYINDPLVHKKVTARLGLDLINNGAFIREIANRLNTPILLLQGGADRIVSPQLTAEFAQRAPKGMVTYREYEGHYHELHNEPDQTDIIQSMVEWCKQFS